MGTCSRVEGYTPQSRAAMALVNFSGTAGSGPQAPTRVIRVTSPFLVPLLNDALQNPSAEVRSAALSSLGKIGAGSVPGLLIALKNADPEVRGLAALALKSMGTGAAPAVAELATALSDPVEPVRIGAADALGAIGPAATAAVPALAARLADKSEGRFVFRSSLQSLGMIGPGAKAALPTLDEIVRQTGPNSVAAQTIRLIEGKDVATYY